MDKYENRQDQLLVLSQLDLLQNLDLKIHSLGLSLVPPLSTEIQLRTITCRMAIPAIPYNGA